MKACAVRLTMIKVRDAVAEILDRLTLADMLMLEGGRRLELIYEI